MKTELSIIAVVIDNIEVTERFVSSIKQYTKGNYELILIDNASKNKKAIKYFKKVSDVYYRFNKRTDLAKAWNKGIALSKGRFIEIANNDTVVPPDWFKLLKQTLTKNKKIGVVSPITYWLIKGYYEYGNLRNFDKKFKKPFKLIKFKDIVWGEFLLFKRKALEDAGGFNEIYKVASAEDLEMCFQLYSKGYEIYVDPRVFVYHQGSASANNKNVISKKKKNKYWHKNYQLFKSRWPKYTKEWG